MRAARYDQLLQHKADHERLIDVLRDIMDAAPDAPDRSAEHLVEVLGDWFAGHFSSHDARLHNRLGPHDHP
jgi:hemerythrin